MYLIGLRLLAFVRCYRIIFSSLFLLSLTTVASAFSDPLPDVFLDCDNCDYTYVRRELPFVNWVRDPADALVHVQVISQRTASGGREYDVDFIGRHTVVDNKHRLKVTVPPQATRDERREKLTNLLKIGLLSYISAPELLAKIAVTYTDSMAGANNAPTHDPWDSWVFAVDGDGWLEKEANQSSFDIDGSLSVRRITAAWRFQIYLRGEYERDTFRQDNRTINSSTHEQRLSSRLVKSLGPHWSVGLRLRTFSNTFDNIDLGWQCSPAIEYSLYDYVHSSRRAITFAYALGHRYQNYTAPTIYDKEAETLINHSLDIDLRFNRPWGEARASIEGSQYINDFSRYRIESWGRLSLRLVKGFSVYLEGHYARLNDQFSLVRGSATLEEILLQRRNLATDYEFNMGLGLSYTFGSIYNNVVNTRL